MTNDPSQLHKRIIRQTRRSAVTDRQLILRSKGRIRYVMIPASLQVVGLLVLGAFGAWVAHASYTYMAHDQILSAKNAAISVRDETNRALQTELDTARQSFVDATDSLEKNHKGLVSLIGQNRTLEENLAALQRELSRVDQARTRAENEKRVLAARAAALENNLSATKTRNYALARDLDNTGSELADALADKSHATRHGQNMSTRVGALKRKLAALREAQSELLERVADTTDAQIDRLKSLLASTGIKVDKMMRAEGGATFAQGGPFEAAGKNGAAAEDETFDVALNGANTRLDRLAALQKVMRKLPLAAPLDYFYVSSKYGRRKDPINGKSAMHRGVDFGAKHRATVYATAPGKVIYAGWKGRFGRFIAIDHGNGVITRYGHLRRIYVKLGQKVKYRSRIGQMGSSGRSTGVHLHYEIHVNKRSFDPLRFMKAGKNVFKG